MRIACLDTESDGFLEQATRLWCACIIDMQDNSVLTFTPDNIDSLCSTLETYDILVGHNIIGHDFPLLRKLYGFEYTGEKIDTVLISRTQRPARMSPPTCKAPPNSLEAWGHRLGDFKLAHEDWSKFSPEMLERCVQDTKLNIKVYHALLKEGKGEGWENAHKLNAKLFHWLQRQEEYGWPIDSQLIDRHISTLDRWISNIDKAINPRLPLVVEVLETKSEGEFNYVRKPFTKAGGLAAISQRWIGDGDISVIGGPFCRVDFRSVDLDSNAETKDFLLALGWQPKEYNTNNEGEKTSPKFSKDDDFEGLQGGLARLIARRIKCRGRKSILEGWKASIRNDGRIPSRVTGGAQTGRLRHSGIVNVPNPNSGAFFAKQMRSVFICKEGWKLVGVDSKGNQIRQLAARMGDEEFTEAVLNGDPHSLNQKRVGGNVSRNAIKAFFYSLIFGAQDNKTAKILKISKEAAHKIRTDYLNGMPKLKDLLEREAKAWRASAKKRVNKWGKIEYYDGYIKALDGRPILVEQEHTILVYYLQADESLMMNTAYVWSYKDLERAGYAYGKDFGIVSFFHDEINTECRADIAEDVGRIIAECIVKSGKFYGIPVPHAGDIKIGNNWLECH
jgi:DNA polymerase-1